MGKSSRKKKLAVQKRRPPKNINVSDPEAQSPKNTTKPVVLIALVLIAALTRALFLGRAALWGDEIIHLNIQANPQMTTWQVFLNYWNVVVSMAQVPLAGVLLNAYVHFASNWFPQAMYNPLILRIPGVLLGSFSVLGVYLLTRDLLQKWVGWAVTAMMTFFFYPVFYSREVYCYPYVIFFSSFALLFFVRLVFLDRRNWLQVGLLAVMLIGLVLSHLGGTILLVALASVTGVVWLTRRFGRKDKEAGIGAFRAGIVCAVAGLAVAPYWIRILTQDNPHMAQSSGVPVFSIVRDVVSKMFLGDAPALSVLAFLLMGIGVVSMLRSSRQRGAKAGLIAVYIIAFSILVWATKQSQYLSARYFSPLAPIAYMLLAQGLYATADGICKALHKGEKFTRNLFFAMLLPVLGVHIFVFLPNMYMLREKGIPYSSIARWLNENASPGTPYFFDCGGWDLRYVPGYNPTPGLTPTVHIAWNGPDYDRIKKEIQRSVMAGFPESCYIEDPNLEWPEAHDFYRNKQEFRNDPLINLRKYGIWIDANTRNHAAEYRDIWYNTRSDAMKIEAGKGSLAFFDFPDFVCAQVAQEKYARVKSSNNAEVLVTNLTGKPIRGRFRFVGSVVGPSDKYRLRIYENQNLILTVDRPASSLWEDRSDPLMLSAGQTRLYMTTEPGLMGPAQAIVLVSLTFEPEAATSEGPKAQ